MQKWREWETAAGGDWELALEREAILRPLANPERLIPGEIPSSDRPAPSKQYRRSLWTIILSLCAETGARALKRSSRSWPSALRTRFAPAWRHWEQKHLDFQRRKEPPPAFREPYVDPILLLFGKVRGFEGEIWRSERSVRN